METQLTTTPASTNNDVVQKKRKSWADLGEATHNLDLKLQAMAQSALNDIAVLPTTITDIPLAEQKLKDVKRKFVEIKTERMTVTSKLEIIKDRLMLSEESGSAPVAAYEKTIIAIKKADEEVKKQDKLKADNVKACREYLAKYKADKIAVFNKSILDAVGAKYTFALGDGNITTEGLEQYITQQLSKATLAHFTILAPIRSFEHISNIEFKALCDELITNDPTSFLKEYERLLRHKFSDYEIALNNKVQALENDRIEKELADKKAAEEKQNAEIAAQLASVAVTPVVDSGIRKLKSEYKIDMEETLENSVIVMTAFVANIAAIRPMLKVNKFDSFNIGQMKTYLCKIKTMDEEFSYTGIVFKTIDKL